MTAKDSYHGEGLHDDEGFHHEKDSITKKDSITRERIPSHDERSNCLC